MTPSLSTWIALPLLGAVIGYVTNTIAVKMIFRPIRPRRFLGLRIQGLIGRRQSDLAQSIGRVVGDHLLEHEDVVECFEKVDFEAVMKGVLDKGLGPKIAELKSLPLIGGFLTDERVGDIQKAIVSGVLRHKQTILEQLEDAVEKGLDVRRVVTDKVAAFPVDKLERLVLDVASRELRSIELLGGALGLLIGLVQVLVLTFLGP